MDAVPVYLSLGSNLGDRRSNILTAVSSLEDAIGSCYSALSDIIETESWGFDAPPFLNCAVRFDTDIAPESLLRICKEIEIAMGRDENVQYDDQGNRIYHSRIIDIDILFHGHLRMSTPALTIPHPLIAYRDFVKIPLKQIAEASLRDEFPDIFA